MTNTVEAPKSEEDDRNILQVEYLDYSPMLQLGLCSPNEFDGNFVTVAGVSDFKLKNNLEILRLKEDDPKLLEFDG